MLDRVGYRGAAGDHRRARARARRRRLRADPDPRRRAGGAAARRDDPARRAAASGRRRPAPAASPRRCARCRWCSRSPTQVRRRAAPDAWIVDFTNPVGIVTRALLDAGHRAVGLCNVAITLPAPRRRSCSASSRRASRSTRSGSTTSRGCARCGSTARTCSARCWPTTATRSPRAPGCRGGCSRSSASCPPTTCTTSTSTTACWPSSARACRARPRSPRSSAQLLEMYRDPTLNEKPALLEQRGGAFYSEAATGHRRLAVRRRRRGARGRHAQRRHAGRAGRRRRRRGAGARRRRTARCRCAQAPLAPELLGLTQHVAAYERLAVRAALSGSRARRRARRCSRIR